MITESSITRALFCQEIAEAIFSHLSLDSVASPIAHRGLNTRENLNELEQRKKRCTLASAACVSKYISEVALSVLWARLNTFRHLFRVLPQYTPRVWYEEDEDCLNGKPTETDWVRFEKYAALIREARLSYVPSNEQKVWEMILNRYPTAHDFLPRLAALEKLYVTSANTLFSLPLLLPTLRHLSVKLDTCRPRIQSSSGALLITTALERIAAEIPYLASLKISCNSRKPLKISWEMAPFQSLHRLHVTSDLIVDTSVRAAAGQFHGLHALSISIDQDCSHLHSCFQALIELSVRGSPSHIQSFLIATSPPRLQSLSLFFACDPNTDLLMQCLSIIPTTLSALALESDLTFDPPITSVIDIIQPALRLRALTHFKFKFRPLPSLTDNDVLAMLAAWPSLTTLRITRSNADILPHTPPARPTALLFPSIVSRAPHLDTLELPEVDLSVAPALAALLPGLGPRGHPLRLLDMSEYESGGTDRNACIRAAVMLDWLFPRMELPRLRDDVYDQGREKGWAAVVRLLHAMQAGRAHADAFDAWYAGEGDDGMEVRDEGESDEDTDSE